MITSFLVGGFLIGVVFSILFTPWVIKLAEAFDVVRYPPSYYLSKVKKGKQKLDRYKIEAIKRRLEKPPTPEWGGIAYVVGFLIISAVGLLASKTINLGAQYIVDYLWWGLGILVLLINGILDDKFDMPSVLQLFSYFLATLFFIFSSFSIGDISIPFLAKVPLDWTTISLGIGSLKIVITLWSDVIVFLFLLYMIMALKVQAGTDAVMEFNTLVALLFFVMLSYVGKLYSSAFMAAVLAGLLLGFVFYNWYPAKIWSGEAGDAVIGYIIGTFAIIGRFNLSAVLLLFAIPIVDFAYVLLKRIKRVLRTHRRIIDIFKISDRNHLHHRLLALGVPENKIPFVEGAVTAIIGVLLVILPHQYRKVMLPVVYLVLLIALILIDFKASKQRLNAKL